MDISEGQAHVSQRTAGHPYPILILARLVLLAGFLAAGVAILVGIGAVTQWVASWSGSVPITRSFHLAGYLIECALLVGLNLAFAHFTKIRPAAIGFTISARTLRGAAVGLAAAASTGGLTFLLSWQLMPLHVATAAGAGDVARWLPWAFLVILFQAGAEEVWFRAWAARYLASFLGKHGAALAIGVAFAALHLLNPAYSIAAMVNAGLAGVMCTYAVLNTRSLALPIALHVGWNWATGGVLFSPHVLAVTDMARKRVNSFDGAEATPWGLALVAVLAIGVILTTRTHQGALSGDPVGTMERRDDL